MSGGGWKGSRGGGGVGEGGGVMGDGVGVERGGEWEDALMDVVLRVG